MMRIWALLITLVLALAFQTALAPDISPWGLIPDIILLIVVAYSLLKGPIYGMLLGIIGGFATDLIGGGLIGVHALSKMVIGLLCGVLEKTIFKDSLLVPAIAAGVVTLLHDLIAFLVMISFGHKQSLLFHLVRYTLPLTVYHMVLAPAIYRLVFRGERYIMLRKSL